jgi:hypothetical protein
MFDPSSAIWGYGFGRIVAEREAEREARRKAKALAIESVSFKGEKVVVRVRNVGSECDFDFFSVSLHELYTKPKEKSVLFGIIKISKSGEILAGYMTNDWIPMNDFREIELKPKKKLLPGRMYKVVVDWGDAAVAYNFTVDNKGNIIPK